MKPPVQPQRFDRVDALRALAMWWMTAYHFAFDLEFFGWLQADFYRDPFWTLQRTAIVSLFLFCAGLGQAVASAQGQSWSRFWRRWAQVAGCALLVSAGSWWMFPNSYIYFGVLHGMAVMLLLVRLSARWPTPVLLAGVGLAWLAPPLAAGVIAAQSALDWLNTPWANWLGLISHKPITEDYVPVLPWLGVMWTGLLAGRWALRRRPSLLSGPSPRPLSTLGRWSLSYYMLHQPMLLGLLTALKPLLR
ncbi:heparan-alpha-glucosaminide N-acetyltransferase [Hydrogenophaga sp. OTU3427]|uniref:heparan-alpha-glucosaminide N-acetyltransferase n=1 Tax=Hydrogenophaga sp. OTU3427 TaxID=3043856 RepID=UPI00313E9FBA